MPTNLRISLTALSIGFAIEGGGELYTLATPGMAHPAANVWFIVPALLTLIGVLFVWIGRHEWNEVHHDRTRRATQVFALSLVGGVATALLIGLLVAYPSIGTPWWAEGVFGAGLASLLFGTFVTYAYLIFHLVAVPSRVALGAAVAWALLVSAFITVALASDLPTLLGLVRARKFSIPTFLTPVETLASYLFVSYFLLLAAYMEAHVVVARGLANSGTGPSPPPPPVTPS